MNKNDLKELAQETIKISKGLNSKSNFTIFKDNIGFVLKPNMAEAFIEVYNESTVKAIHRYSGEKVGVLNFASAKHQCGGFIVGSMAQEECLAYCSDLYIKQCANAQEYYDYHNNNNLPLYSDLMFIDDIVFFRDDKFNMCEPITCKVLTSAAVNTNLAKNHGKTDKDIYIAMKNRMRKILNCFIISDCKTIILGAFGCGVFGNSAQEIAKIWYELLYEEEYVYHFEKICFSVLDNGKTGNFEAFKNQFGK